MRKTILSVCAAAAFAFTSCQNEVDMFQTIGTPKGTLEFNITSDDELKVNTRASQTADNSAWYATVGKEAQALVKSFEGKTYKAETELAIKVSNYTDLNAALAANEGAGDAYYEGETSVKVVKGNNPVSIDCGKAKNSKLSVDWKGAAGVEGLSVTNVVANQNESRTYTYTTSGSAFFKASENIACTINYTYNGAAKTIKKTFTAPAAATEYKLTVTANSNGKLTTITINYDDEFTVGGETKVEFDAATGEEVVAAE